MSEIGISIVFFFPVATEVFSWGNGANYQLGTGNQHVQKLPCRVDSLHGCYIKLVSAAKFHSVAVSSHGEVYTWGFGRGGRLGHPEFDIHRYSSLFPHRVVSFTKNLIDPVPTESSVSRLGLIEGYFSIGGMVTCDECICTMVELSLFLHGAIDILV